jgi:putative NADPH-quinone reductase
MTYGFSGTGGLRNNRKQPTLYSIPWSLERFIDVVYKTRQSQSYFAYEINQNGNQQANRIRNFYTTASNLNGNIHTNHNRGAVPRK